MVCVCGVCGGGVGAWWSEVCGVWVRVGGGWFGFGSLL